MGKNRQAFLRFDELNKTPDANYNTFKKAIENDNAEISANIMCCLINVTSYLLGGLMAALEKAFMNEGGLRERMARAGINKRNKQ